ncbi:UPF0042 nucleotide-binding protein TOPB45_1388 [Caldimicrobium thiodismutans]|jgi:UPF0042 nucleotide-binding protein|uniref:UPF0042 nucleotide-binding protein TOPB45_1388 n=1 Tax=Caldimicrobium thiodismutans TaxID=1653476 RepID=A0A0U5AG09_9BACT|nr:RNase adapter RapZ [Caldimicrobium thiodismutans]BAU22940.1 UPF0042 nucleotide-binding protein TOPB45_1388 [Caldimicrobium thiodismutans]
MKPAVVIITGESGAGKSTALKAFEDLGYLAIDNFPVRLLLPFLDEIRTGELAEKIALVMDLRDPFFLQEFPNTIAKLREKKYSFDIIFLTADLKALITRFSQTRRPHPFLQELKDIKAAIVLEKDKLALIKDYVTLFLDTSNFNVHQLRHEIFKIYGQRKELQYILLHIISFGYKFGIPYEANYLFDARVLPNPYFVPELKDLSGETLEIQKFLLKEPRTSEFLDYVYNFIKWALPLHRAEGRNFLALGIGCTGGRHRSPALALLLAERLKKSEIDTEVVVTLRDVERD